MAIKNITSDYSGHPLKDINICYNINPRVVTQPLVFSFGKVSSYIAGIQKLVQRYAIALLTQLSSQTEYPEFGTELYNTLLMGRIFNNEDIIHVFNFANMKVIEDFRNYQKQQSGIPLDEQLNTAVLRDVLVDSNNGTASFKIYIYTNAGDTVDFLVPVPQIV